MSLGLSFLICKIRLFKFSKFFPADFFLSAGETEMHVKCTLGSAAKTGPWFHLCVSPIGASTGPPHWKHRKDRGDGRKEISRFRG